MSLTDVMSGSGLAGYAEVALVISLVAFLAIAVWTLRRPRKEMEERARAALDDDEGKFGMAEDAMAPAASGAESNENR